MADDIPVATAQDSTEGTVALQPAAQQERQRRPSTSQSGQGAVDSRRATPVQAGSRASSPQAELATQTAEHERHAGVTDNGETSTSGAGHLYPQGYGASDVPNDVIAQLPRYAMPNITSSMPYYVNSEQEFVFRAFNTGNYDLLRHLPQDLKSAQVQKNRMTRMEATRQFLMPALAQPRLKAHGKNVQGTFSAFEYIPSRYSLADELASKERVASETVRLTVGRGQEFKPTMAGRLMKHEDFDPARVYPHMATGFGEVDEIALAERVLHESKFVQPPFFAPGGDKPLSKPLSKHRAYDMMSHIKKLILADWEGVELTIFENDHDCWVIRVEEGSIDSVDGLLAYMNVFLRCNEHVHEYGLSKVVEFWHSQPGDGCLYYVVRPPWVKPQHVETFFTLHPEERDWRTSFPVQQMAQERATQRAALKAVDDGGEEEDGGVATEMLHQAMARLGLQVAGIDAFVPSVPNTAR